MRTITVAGSDETSAVLAGLMEILRLARGDELVADAASDTVAVPLRGQGSSLGDVFAELSRDLLAQLDAQGTGLDRVRLDGLLNSQDGYVGWGYLEGASAERGGAARVDLVGEPSIDRGDTGITLTFSVDTT